MSSVGASTSVESSVAAIVVPPSGSWDGNDGPWSTFNIHVGTPPQSTKVLVSTSIAETWVVSANKTQGGCLASAPSNCPDLRGGLVNVNMSSTWHDEGIFNLLDYRGEYDNGDYGFDALGLGLPGSGGINFKSQTIAAISTPDFYLGFLGVNQQPVNFTSFTDPQVSFLASLKQSNNTPSLSFAYSAGARYRQNMTATLTLGGYDASKFDATSGASFTMGNDISRDLVVNLQTIILNNIIDRHLLPKGISIFIDAAVPHIWLPRDSCSLFEDAFGLVYNDTVNRYLVNETLHSRLQSQNASVSFLLGPDATGAATVNVTLPYSSFDLEIGPPIVNVSQRYFPLRRADNGSQYTLGRTFLQEAYLIVDYERSNFSIYQNSWAPNLEPQIVSILAANSNPGIANKSSANDSPAPTTGTNKTPPGVTAGAVLGAIAICIMGVILSLYYLRKIRARRKATENSYGKAQDVDILQDKPEMDGRSKAYGELDAMEHLAEIDGKTPFEMQGRSPDLAIAAGPTSELEGSRGGAELKGTSGGVEKGDDIKAVERKDEEISRVPS